MIRRVLLELDAPDELAVIKLIKGLLKQLGRVHRVRCKSARIDGGEG